MLVSEPLVAQAPQWNATGSMSVDRRDHTATLLTNGKVLIVGGYGWTSGFTNIAELYDPATGSFSPTGSAQYIHGQRSTATRLADGRVLIVGGYDGIACQKIAEIYDPSTATFTATANPPVVAHAWHTATLLPNGKVLIAGGYDASFATQAVAELYDPAAGTFQLTGSLIADRAGHSATLLPSGKVLVTGGVQTTTPGFGICLNSVEIYDPATGLFSAGPNMPVDRCSPDATLLPSGKV